MCQEARLSKVEIMKDEIRRTVLDVVVMIHRGSFNDLATMFKGLLLKASLPTSTMTPDEVHQVILFLPEAVAPLMPFYTGDNRNHFLGELLRFSETMVKGRYIPDANLHLGRLERMPGSPFNVPLPSGVAEVNKHFEDFVQRIIVKHGFSMIKPTNVAAQLDEIHDKLTSGTDTLGPKVFMMLMSTLGDGGSGFIHIVDDTLRCLRTSVKPFRSMEFAKFFIRAHFNTFKSVFNGTDPDDSLVRPVFNFLNCMKTEDILVKANRPGAFKGWSIHQLNKLEYVILAFDSYGEDPSMLPLLRAIAQHRFTMFSV